MASNTAQVERIRASKRVKMGRRRKNAIAKVGTTAPNLPLNKPNANERALKAKTKA